MENFTNQEIDINQLPQYQDVALTKPNAAYIKVIVINILLFFLVLGSIIGTVLYFNPETKAINYSIAAYFTILSIVFYIYFKSFKKRGYAVREKDIIYKAGIIAEKTTIVPFNRIQHIALNEGIFSRIFKLASLHIYTAGGHSGEIKISGLEVDKAKAIKEILLQQMEQTETLTTSTI
jgi:membrane protein YdbS with pleckstrin-like domain